MTDYTIPNPAFAGQNWGTEERREIIPGVHGACRLWGREVASGVWRVKAVAFDADAWPERDKREEWVKAHREELTGMDATQVRIKTSNLAEKAPGVGFGPKPTDEDLEIINQLALEPMTADDVYVRRMKLANDIRDRDLERFSRGVLKQFAETLPGKSTLIGHEKRSAPVGRFYKAEVVKEPNGPTWLYGYWYAPVTADNEHDRKSIDSGVWSNVSIGFVWDWQECDLCGENYRSGKCPHVIGEQTPIETVNGRDLADMMLTEDGKQAVCTLTYRGKAEALEGSIVYLGAQYGAEMAKAKMAGDAATEKRLLLQSEEKSVDTSLAPANGEPAVGDGVDVGVDESATGAVAVAEPTSGDAQAIDTKESDAMSDELGVKLTETEAALTAAGEKIAALEAALEAEKARSEALRAPVAAEVAKAGLTLHRDSELKVFTGLFGDDLAKMPDEQLLTLRDDWAKALDALPGQRQSTGSDIDANIAVPGERVKVMQEF